MRVARIPLEDPMTTQTFHTANNPDTIAVQGPVPTALTSPSSPRSRRFLLVRRAVATAAVSAVALTAFGVTWQIRADDAPAVVPQRATEADLRVAAEWARRMEGPASYTDLRLAAEWARRLEILSTPSAQKTSGGH
jgi:anti-sigma-K factor RskA